MKALSYPSSKNPFSLLTASPGFVAEAGPGWQISTGGAAERRSANVDCIGLADKRRSEHTPGLPSSSISVARFVRASPQPTLPNDSRGRSDGAVRSSISRP